MSTAESSAPAAGCRPAEQKQNLVFGLAVVLVAVLIYANTLPNGFVWDDSNIIVANTALRGEPLSLFKGIDAARASEPTPYYRPLALLTFLIEDRLHGLTPSFMHIINVLLHAANAFLVFRLARFLLQDSRGALLAGLLFAVHPINTETVAFLSARNTLLAGLFVLIACLLHHSAVLKGTYGGAMAGAVFFLAGLFSKETAVGIAPFIAALELPAIRERVAGAKARAAGRLAPYVVCASLYFLLRKLALSDAGVTMDIVTGLGGRLLQNVYIIPRYFLSLIWPPSISVEYFVPDDLHLLALPLFAAWLGIIVIMAWLITKGRSRATVFGLSWIVIFWLPVSGIIPFPSTPLADRYLYLPEIGLWVVLADQFVRRMPSGASARRCGMTCAALVLVVLAGWTIARNPDWKNDITLFSHYVEQYPDVARGHHNLGCAYLDKRGDLDAAQREFEKAAALDPRFPRLWTQLGYIGLLRGNYREAVRSYTEAIRQNPFDGEALLNRATALDRLGDYKSAVIDYKRFLAAPGNELPGARPQVEARVRELAGAP